MSDAPSIAVTVITGAVGIATAFINRGTPAAIAEAKKTADALGTRLTTLEAQVKTAADGAGQALREVAAIKGKVDELRAFVEQQLRAARSEISGVRRTTGQHVAMNVIEDVQSVRESTQTAQHDLVALATRVTTLEQWQRDDQRAEGSRQREFGEIVAMLRMLEKRIS